VTTERATIAAARDLMLRWNAGEAYVVDARGKLLGVVPDYEFLKAELGGVDGAAAVKSLVSAKVESVEADADIASVLPKFREGWCGRIAVTDRGRLVGRLTRSEVLRLVAHLRMVASVTEATAEAAIAGPHFGPRRERLAPVRKTPKATRARGGRKVRRLAAG
ncbi:MAG TPA: CBS domain-containing protein, partial [Planctomycetaceae bacterium]